jgi:hypothetical protein
MLPRVTQETIDTKCELAMRRGKTGENPPSVYDKFCEQQPALHSELIGQIQYMAQMVKSGIDIEPLTMAVAVSVWEYLEAQNEINELEQADA